jgi:hypothetical protein
MAPAPIRLAFLFFESVEAFVLTVILFQINAIGFVFVAIPVVIVVVLLVMILVILGP